MNQKFNSVWDALEDTPKAADNLKIRAELMHSILQALSNCEIPSADKATSLGITQPRLNDLEQGRIHQFTIDALIDIASNAGLHIHLTAEPA